MSFPSPLKNRSSNADAETSPAVPPMWSSPAPTTSSKENVRPAEEDTGAVVVIVVVAAAAAATAKAEASPTKMTPKNEPIKEEEEHTPTAGVVVIGAAGAVAVAKAKPTADELFPGVMEIVNGNIQEKGRTPTAQYNAAQAVAATPTDNRKAIIGMQEVLDNHTKMFASYEKRIAELEGQGEADRKIIAELMAASTTDKKCIIQLQAAVLALQAQAAPPVKKRKTTEPAASEPSG
jgi:uncharacterized coiled-coil protein SlyX